MTFFKQRISAAEDLREEPSVMGAGGGLPPIPRIIVPDFCKVHLHDFITKRLEMSMDTSDRDWQRWVITGQALLFGLVLRAERTQKLLRSGRELQEVLKSQGC